MIINKPGHRMAVMPLYGETLQTSSSQALLTRVLQCVYKSMILFYHRFYGKANIGHMCRKTVKMTLKGKTSRKWASGQNIYEFEKESRPR